MYFCDQFCFPPGLGYTIKQSVGKLDSRLQAAGFSFSGEFIMSQIVATLHHGRKVWRSGNAAPLRRSIAVLAAGGGAVALLVAVSSATPALADGIVASFLAGLATGIGAVAAFGLKRLSMRGHDALLGGAAGVMLAAALFSLLLPALDILRPLMGGDGAAAALASAGLILGAAAMGVLERYTPHAHEGRVPGGDAARNEGMWLVAAAIALHNFPEGFSVGASYGAAGSLGLATAIGIGLQNVPEGLVVAAAMLGGLLAGFSGLLLPLSLAAAAGAMIFVVSHEMVPESHRRGHEDAATGALMAGFILMLVLAQAAK